jgi:hypothetical protein
MIHSSAHGTLLADIAMQPNTKASMPSQRASTQVSAHLSDVAAGVTGETKPIMSFPWRDQPDS